MEAEPGTLEMWPGAAVEVPALEVYPDAFRHGEWIWLGDPVRDPSRSTPEELALRQAVDTDVDDLDAVTEIARTVGGLTSPFDMLYRPQEEPGRDLWPGKYRQNAEQQLQRFSARHGRTWKPRAVTHRLPEYDHARDELLADPRGNLGLDPVLYGYSGTWLIHVDEIGLRLHQLRTLGMYAVALNTAAPMYDVTSDREPEVVEPPILGARGETYETEEPSSWDSPKRWEDLVPGQDLPTLTQFDFRHGLQSVLTAHFSRWINFCMTPFHASVWPVGLPRDEHPTFLQVGALQLYNDAALGLNYTRCAHCGRYFGRQIGGSAGVRRSRAVGVRFCSKKCSNAAGTARYRAKQNPTSMETKTMTTLEEGDPE